MKKLLKSIITISLSSILLSTAGCSSYKASEPLETAKPFGHPPVSFEYSFISDNDFNKTQFNFSAELFKQTAAQAKGQNILVSPTSAMLALAMVANGADGDTLSQFEKTLGKISGDENITIEDLNAHLLELSQSLNRNDDRTTTKIANSIWIKDRADFAVNQSFLDICSQNYRADSFKTKFDKNSLKDIDNWVEDKTDGNIKDFSKGLEFNETTVMLLLNTLFLEAEWTTTYQDHSVAEKTFTSYSGEKRKVDMMKSTEYGYYIAEDAKVLHKSLTGNYEFVAILPNEGVDIYNYISTLTAEKLDTAINTVKDEAVYTMIPKFDYEYDFSLNDTLKNTGITDAFKSGVADFSNISETELYISDVKQKTFIEVGQQGVKAGAVTSVEVNCGSALIEGQIPEIYLDRPFVYIIKDIASGLPLFLGAVADLGK